ncbi:helix-turn-helix domain-containing protein [Nonomuraea sp. 10N515B]|uniref:helix-turn-helix domain-containing protein n=1 Tax=Nonomuraea sp. 10N515B TaxID=3457422 RepID=UPI003FCEE13A
MRTLRIFLDCAGSWNACAEQLHVHLNTVCYTMADRVDFSRPSKRRARPVGQLSRVDRAHALSLLPGPPLPPEVLKLAAHPAHVEDLQCCRSARTTILS